VTRTNDGLKPLEVTRLDPSSVQSGVKPPGMTPMPEQRVPRPFAYFAKGRGHRQRSGWLSNIRRHAVWT
jgi:hypothetical protein